MTKPISQERIDWLRERLRVVDESLKFTRSAMHAANAYVAASHTSTELSRVVSELNTERAKIEVELQVLSKLVVGD